MKILITGGNGFLGSRFARFLSLSHEVVALSSRQLDITDGNAVRNTFLEVAPHIVLHLAALADTQYCRQNPEDSYLINVKGTKNVAEAAAAVGARLIFASSEQVYDGQADGPANREDLELCPRTPYAQHKLEAERLLEQIVPAVALRLTWMYDLPTSPLPQRSGLLINITSAAREGRLLKASTREQRGITYVWDVVKRIEAAFSLPPGVYNFGATTEVSTYSTYLWAAEKLLLVGSIDIPPQQLVVPDDTWTRNLAIDLSRLRQFGINFPDTIEGLNQAILYHRSS